RGRQAHAHWAIALAGRSVAASALLLIQRGTLRKIGRTLRPGHDRISRQQRVCQRVGAASYIQRRRFSIDLRNQRICLSEERRSRGGHRKSLNPASRGPRELAHFRVFRGADYRAVPDRTGVIGREIIDHLPRLRDRGGGVPSERSNAREKSECSDREKKPDLGTANATRSHPLSIAASVEDVVWDEQELVGGHSPGHLRSQLVTSNGLLRAGATRILDPRPYRGRPCPRKE